ncbi:MAG: hypothetical protein HY353_04450 [Candidatus Omnitrophica bacterium]|nr:hypothetical protein [Candidatus Omnitrophota bacterium]
MVAERIRGAASEVAGISARPLRLVMMALVCALVSIGFGGDSSAALAVQDALTNGGFEHPEDGAQSPEGWEVGGRTERVESSADGGGAWALRLSSTTEEPNPRASQSLDVVQPLATAVTVAGLVRIKDVHPIGDGKGAAKVTVSFLSVDGRVIRRKTIRTWDGTFGWRPWSGSVRIPKGAGRLELALELEEALGQATFDAVQLLWGLPDDHDRENLVVDGGFEYVNPLSVWELDQGAKVVYPGAEGHAALEISRDQPGHAAARQRLVFAEASIREATLTFDLKLKKVKARAPGGGAKVELGFWDREGEPVGKPVVVGPWAGTQETWKSRAKQVRVPPAASEATLGLLLDQARGTAWFDGVRLAAHGAEGPLVRRLESRTDIATWRVIEPSIGPLEPPFDASGLLNPPAGQHGFLTVEDGRFVFEDGTPARFFGVNIDAAANFPSHEHADRFAERLAQLGCNLVRLHHLDAPWADPNIFAAEFEDTQHLSRESLDRLDYFIAQLKARGIYIYMDLLVSRQFKSGDGVPAYRQLSRGAKIAAQYSPRLIQLQKAYARDLLTHYNRYTRTRLVEEPALVLVDLINESSLAADSKRFKELPGPYRDELQLLWGEYLSGQGVDRATMDAERYLEVDDPFVQGFYTNLQQRYFDELYGYLRGLGLSIPIAGSNRSTLSLRTWELATNATLDFIDRHDYWDHPKGGYGDLVRFHNRSMIEGGQEHHPIAKLSVQRVAGVPFVVSEWNIPWPNEYRAVGPLLMAAYASFQNWDGLLLFTYDGDLAATRIANNFDVSTMPEQFLQLPAAARLFHRREVQPARLTRAYPIDAEHQSISPGLPLRHGVARVAGDAAPPKALAMASNPWVSDTGELAWDERHGRVSIKTARVQAVVGQMGDGPLSLPDATFSVETPFASVVLSSLDEQPVVSSRHLLLTTVARSENTGTVYNATRTLLRDSGTGPILMEPVMGSVSMPLGGRRPTGVFALDTTGRRVSEVAASVREGSIEVPLGEALAYEIVFEEPS